MGVERPEEEGGCRVKQLLHDVFVDPRPDGWDLVGFAVIALAAALVLLLAHLLDYGWDRGIELLWRSLPPWLG